MWDGLPCWIIACGPSLTQDDVYRVRMTGDKTIVVNLAFRLAPWADVLWGCDGDRFWLWYPDAWNFAGLKCSLYQDYEKRPDIMVLGYRGAEGLDTDPEYVSTGYNGGHQAINLAYHFGVSEIRLLGYDMRPNGTRMHFHQEHPMPTHPDECNRWLRCLKTLEKPLADAGVSVINYTRETAVDWWPCRSMDEVGS